MNPVRTAIRGVADSRILRPLRQAWYETQFASATGPVRLFRGVYPTFAEALATVPSDRPVGFDNPLAARRLAEDRHRVFPSDYPVLYWLTRLLPEARVLFDFGGNVGISYFAYRRYLNYRDSLDWVVYDLPAVTALGEQLARESDCPGLRFVTDLTTLEQADIVLAAASLQFLDDPLGWLRDATVRPRWILINKTPLTDCPSVVTLHAIGASFCGYRLFNRPEFMTAFGNLGYRPVDVWTNADIGCEIPFHPEYRIAGYTGVLFERVS
jgi:putative methyltransferase (TIGR04325 family)